VRLSLVVPATDSPATLGRCLDAVAAATAPPEETIAVTTATRPGPAAARNEGARRATGDVVVFVDADVLVHADAFERIRTAFGDDPELVAVFGSYDDQVATTGVVAGFRNLLHHTVHQRCAGPAATFWAGLGAVRRDAFLAAGGFDEDRYPLASIEDIELGGRLAPFGPLVLDPVLLGTHLKEWTLRSMVTTDYARRGVPWVALMTELRSVPATLNLGARERLSVGAALAATASTVARRPVLAAAAATAMVALNRDLYATVHRRLGMRGMLAAIPLHALHQLVAVAALPAGVVAGLRRGRRA
jgi:GT2 family glycosyltransferase